MLWSASRRGCLVSVPLDAAVRAGGPLPVAARDGLRGNERREHCADPLHREGFWVIGSRPPVATARWASLIPQFFRTWITRTSPNNSMANAEWWAAGIPNPAYAIDDQTAIKVTSGTVEVVSEGQLEAVHPSPQASQPA